MPDLFDVLSQDHQEVQRMLTELEIGPTAATGSSGSELALRKKMVEQLAIEESKHEALEEMYFWPAVRDKIADGGQLADTAIEQEQLGREVLNQLDKLDPGQLRFEQLLINFIAAGREHIRFEEGQVWPRLRSVLGADEARSLGDRIAAWRSTAPTRPHPNTPTSPGGLSVVRM
jgi:hemerythrin-like domain-containing protein